MGVVYDSTSANLRRPFARITDDALATKVSEGDITFPP